MLCSYHALHQNLICVLARPADLIEGTTSNLTLCEGDHDEYWVYAPTAAWPKGWEVAVTVQTDAYLGLSLYDEGSSSSSNWASASEGNSKTLRFDGRDTRKRLSISESTWEELWPNYSVTIAKTEIDCAPDFLEPNEFGSQATTVPAGLLTELSICGSDSDWHRISIPGGKTAIVNATFNSTDGNLDISLWRASSGSVYEELMTSSTGTGTEVIEYTNNNSSPIIRFVEVWGPLDPQAVAYTLDIQFVD